MIFFFFFLSGIKDELGNKNISLVFNFYEIDSCGPAADGDFIFIISAELLTRGKWNFIAQDIEDLHARLSHQPKRHGKGERTMGRVWENADAVGITQHRGSGCAGGDGDGTVGAVTAAVLHRGGIGGA